MKIKENFFNECIHSEEPDMTCPFAEQQSEKTLCSQILGWHTDTADVSELKSCFMTSSPRDKLSIVNKIKKNPGENNIREDLG